MAFYLFCFAILDSLFLLPTLPFMSVHGYSLIVHRGDAPHLRAQFFFVPNDEISFTMREELKWAAK